MAILITGGTGFIGSHLAAALLQKGYEIVLFDISPNIKAIEHIKDKVKLVRGDLSVQSDVLDAVRLNNIEGIFHLGAILSAAAEEKPMTTFGVNFNGTMNVLEASRMFNLRKVIYSSSIASYGPGLPQPVVETVRQEPQSTYGISKVFSELWGLWYNRRYGIDFRVLRLPVVIGPGRGVGGASAYATLIVQKMALAEKYEIDADENAKLPLIYYKDAVRALLALYEAKEAPSHIYNITAMSPTAKEILGAVMKLVPHRTVEFKPKPEIVRIVHSWPQMLDDSRARKEFNWEPAFTLESMIKDFVKEVQMHRELYAS